MKRSLVALSALAASAFLIPDEAAAQRGGFGFRGGAPSFRGGAGPVSFRPPMAGIGRPGFGGGAIGMRPGGFRPALAGPGFGGYGRVINVGRPYGRGWGYPYYAGYYRRGWGYPYYGGALLAGLTLGALSYPFSDGYYGDPHLYSGVSYGGECYWVRRWVTDPWGRVVRRRVQVCEY
ncbi:hypothetical protein [Microvirga aerophila]|uniref:Uncharacterized protein n=1 Tax=Microvirga aerophila TaxID=670291 RepID=A0A512C517_9HYPH|nr:hypothetical protein [Microvirga aerophila]GEO19250.1 hypothetical protein MAE02_69460 [Microvirga aerophila]